MRRTKTVTFVWKPRVPTVSRPTEEDQGENREPLSIPPERSGTTDLNQPERDPIEIGGPKGPEPTRYRDWERNGRCIDF
jgi:hypothetical protein